MILDSLQKFSKFILEFFNYDDLPSIKTYFQIIFHFSRSFFQGDIQNLYTTFSISIKSSSHVQEIDTTNLSKKSVLV